MFNIMEMLEKQGHEVIPFSVRSDKNADTPYDKYFVDPIGGSDQVYYEDYKKTPRVIMQLIARGVYSPAVKKAVKQIIADTKPDVAYILHFVNKLSPSVISGAKALGLRVVVRLSDYFLLCPRFDFLRDGRVCEDCLSIGYAACIKNKCVKGSFFASVVRVAAMKIQKYIRVFDKVDLFITPSQFLRDKLVENGYGADRVINITTFTPDTEHDPYKPGDYGLYFGRMSEEKGLLSLVEAYRLLGDGYKLLLAGGDANAEALRLKAYIAEHGVGNVTFTGFLSGEALKNAVRGARYVFMPALWYENIPNTVLEAFAAAKPVISSRIGSLTELVEDGENGLLHTPGDSQAIARCVKRLDDDGLLINMSLNARRRFEERYTGDKHFDKLISALEG